MIKLPNLLPRKNKFDILLEQLATKSHDSARELKAYTQSRDEADAARAGEAIKRIRTEAKLISIDVTRELSTSFITPFDREDIQEFAVNLYKIPKLIEKIRERMELHGMNNKSGDFSQQIDLIVEEAETLQTMVVALLKSRDFAQIKDKIAILHNLEQRGDDILGELLQKLFRENLEARDLILRKDIYDMLEKVIDRFRDVASVTLQIVLKYA
jgi:uncharacterized protein Yka (UPF0111/DUF47 family)